MTSTVQNIATPQPASSPASSVAPSLPPGGGGKRGSWLRKKLLITVAVLVPVAAAGGGYLLFLHRGNPLANARALIAKNDMIAGEIELRRAVREMPDNAEAHFRLGLAQLTLGDPVAAEKELKTARSLGYAANAVIPPLARSYLAQKKFTDLLRDFTIDNMTADDRAAVLVSRALAQIGLQDLDAAAQSVKQAEDLAPSNADAPLAGARVAALRHNLPGALVQAVVALKNDPKSVEALLFKADLLRVMGRPKEAVTVLDTAVSVAPGVAVIKLQRAGTLLSVGEDDAARKDVDALLKVDATNRLAIYYSAVLAVRAKDWHRADTLLGKIPMDLSRLPRGDYFLALVKANVNQLEQATEAGRHYVAQNKADPAGYKLLARIEQMAGRGNDAIDALKNGVTAGVGDAEMLDMLGSAYARSGQISLSLQSMQKAAQLEPDNPQVLARLGSTRLGSGDPEGAERDLNRSLTLAPDRPEAVQALVIAALAAGDVDSANAALDKLRQIKSDPAMVSNLTGLVRMAQLDLSGARQAWQSALDANPAANAVRVNLARVLAMQGHRDEAVAVLKPVLDKEPANGAALSAASTILVGGGEYSKALDLVAAARRAEPDSAELLVGQAQLLARSGDPEKALSALDVAKPELQKSPLVLNARMQLLVGLKRAKEAVNVLRQLVRISPQDVDARRRLVELLLALNDTDGAVRAAQQAMQAVPGSLPVMQDFVTATYRASGLDAALAAADLLLRDPTNLPGARLLKGGLLLALNRPADALAAYQQEQHAAPSAQLATAMAFVLEAQKRSSDAMKTLADENARQHDPMLEQALAALQITAHDYDNAEANLKAVLAVRPTDAVALNNLAWIYQLRNDPQARIAAQKAYTLGPTPQAADTLGWVLATQGQATTGVMLLRQAASQLPDDPTIQYHYAAALNATGQHDEAERTLRGLLAKQVSFDERADAEKLLQALNGPAAPAGAPAVR